MAETRVYNGYTYTQMPDGSWRKGAPVQQAPADPTFEFQGPQAEAQTRQAKAQADVQTQTAPTTIQTNQAPAGTMWVDPNDPAQGVRPIPGYTPKPTAAETNREVKQEGTQRRAAIIRDQIEVVRDLYRKNIKGQPSSRLFGLTEKIDALPDNETFRKAAEAILPLIRPMVAQTAREGDSDKEMEIFMSYIPTNDDSDQTIEQKLSSLERLVAGMTEGAPPSSIGAAADPSKAAGVGATEASVELPEGFQGGYRELVEGLYSGDFTPEQFAAFRVRQDREAFGEEAKDQYYTYLEDGYQLQKAFEAGAQPKDVPGLGPATRELSDFEQARNDLAASDIGTGAINYLDSAGFGGVSLLAGDQVRAASELNPEAAIIGQIGGGITGTAGLAKLGKEAVGRAAPKLLDGGRKAQFARNIATDATYSGIYGSNIGEDPLQSVALGTIGSAGGQSLGKATGAAVGGRRVSEAVKYLRDRNIPLTTGQTLGGVFKGVEDRMAGLPFVGDMVNARRLEGLQAFNRQAFDEAGKPIGFTSRRIGDGGNIDLSEATGRAYEAALEGLDVPLDGQFLDDVQGAVTPLQNLPADVRRPMGQVMDARIQPIADAGRITGPDYQAARRTLKATRNKVPTRFEGFEPEYQQGATDLISALDSQITRGAGPDVVSGLDNANQSNRLGKIVENATERAKGGSGSGEVRTFTPSQLQMAGQASSRKFPGENPLMELADQGQRVLPSTIPDSGTAGRLATLALPGAAAGATGVGALYDGREGAQTGAATSAGLAALLAMLGTKGGQRRLNALIASRPEALQRAGEVIGRKKGLFGSAVTAPLVANQ